MDVPAFYTGEYDYAFDDKGRITVPLDWRQPGFETSLYVFPSDSQCVKVYPASWVARIHQHVVDSTVDDNRMKQLESIATRAHSANIDPQKRITVRDNLRKGAGLFNKKNATLVGRFTHFEIWDAEVWKKSDASTLTIEQARRNAGV